MPGVVLWPRCTGRDPAGVITIRPEVFTRNGGKRCSAGGFVAVGSDMVFKKIMS